MSIQFACSECSAQFLVTKQAVGHRVRCPNCDKIVVVTAPSSGFPATEFAAAGTPPLPDVMAAPEQEVTPPPILRPLDPLPTPARSSGSRFAGAPEPPPAEAPKKEKRFSLGNKRGAIQAEMDMTPMVDVTFLLLIFFMVTASFTMQRSQQIPKQESKENSTQVKSPQELSENPDFITVRIDSNSTYFVSAVSLEDEAEVPSRQELLLKLKQARQPDAQGKMPTKMLVKAHGDALLERVSTAIDAGNEVGIEEVQLLKVEDDES